jgi:hypothetical protein
MLELQALLRCISIMQILNDVDSFSSQRDHNQENYIIKRHNTIQEETSTKETHRSDIQAIQGLIKSNLLPVEVALHLQLHFQITLASLQTHVVFTIRTNVSTSYKQSDEESKKFVFKERSRMKLMYNLRSETKKKETQFTNPQKTPC